MDIKIQKDVKYILNRLIKNNFEAYIVGGCVRDIILNKEPKDYDITTSAKPEEVIKLFDKVILTGIKHGTVTVVLNNENYEVTTFRIDGEYKDQRHPKEVKFVTSLREDLSRRDFTVNAMAYNDIDGFKDYFNGLNDLKNKIIKTVGNPEKRFLEDALRMLRAIRFSAQLNFEIEEETLNAIKKLKYNIIKISKDRIREEFNKIIIYNPRKIDLLRECGLLEFIIKEMRKAYGFNQNNMYHVYDLYMHTIICMENIDAKLHLRLAMLLHDLGKLETKTTDENGISHFYGHVECSIEIAKKVLKGLKYDNVTIENVLILIKYHDYPLNDKITVKRLLNKIGEELLYDLLKVKKADILGKNSLYKEAQLKNLLDVEKCLNNIIENKECFNIKQLKISGNELIKVGLKGKEIGEMLNYLLDMVMEDKAINNTEELIKFAKEKIN